MSDAWGAATVVGGMGTPPPGGVGETANGGGGGGEGGGAGGEGGEGLGGGVDETAVVARAELFELFGSTVPAPKTKASLITTPVVVGFTTIVTVAFAPLARWPREHETLCVPKQEP
jgi:hypothetical protein